MQIIFLLARPRSGTTVLRDIIRRSTNISVMPEILHSDLIDNEDSFFNYYIKTIKSESKMALPSPENRNTLFLGYLSYLGRKFRITDKEDATLIVTVNYNSLHCFNSYWQNIYDPPFIARLIADNGFKVLHLIRRNVLQTMISEYRARKSGVWHKTINDNHVCESQLKVHIDISNLQLELMLREAEIKIIDDFFKKHTPNKLLSIVYEDLFPENADKPSDESLSKISTFLSMNTSLVPETKYIKTRGKTLRDSIENFEEFQKNLEGTPFEKYLVSYLP